MNSRFDPSAALPAGPPPERAFERDVRALRDKCYGAPSSDGNWDFCRQYWMEHRNLAWLREHAEK